MINVCAPVSHSALRVFETNTSAIASSNSAAKAAVSSGVKGLTLGRSDLGSPELRSDLRSKKIGVPLSMIVNRQLQQFIEEQRIEFSAPLTPNAKTKKILDEALYDIQKGRKDKFSPVFSDINDMDAWLDAK